MTAKDVIRNSLDTSDFMLRAYLDGLSDEDLLLQPVDGFNPIALQLGHLVQADRMFAEMARPGGSPPLPEGFDERHDFKRNDKANAERYLTKDEYLRLWEAQRAATLAALDAVSEADLDRPTGVPYAPTVGAALNLAGVHAASHASQFIVVRRMLGKPIAF